MKEPSMEEDVGDQLPKKVLFYHQIRNKGEVINVNLKSTDLRHFLEEKDSNDDDDQVFYNGCQAISKRESVTIIRHFSPPQSMTVEPSPQIHDPLSP
jgi:hypothetical protein